MVIHPHSRMDATDGTAGHRQVHHAHFADTEDLEAGIPSSTANPSPVSPRNPNLSPTMSPRVGGMSPMVGGSRPASTHRSIYSTRSVNAHDIANIGIGPIMMQRRGRAQTTMSSSGSVKARTVNASAKDKNWRPGQEPGLDPSKQDGGRGNTPELHEVCQITIVDYSEDDMEMHDFNNEEFIEFMKEPQEEWIKCRWINVNGISWDVIQALGKAKKLHRLAIEDLVNVENRTKVDWYTDHLFMILTLHKLIHMHNDDEGEHDNMDGEDGSEDSLKDLPKRSNSFIDALKSIIPSRKPKPSMSRKSSMAGGGVHDPAIEKVTGHTIGLENAPIRKLRTLQRYHGGPNEERMEYMEKHSVLTKKQLAVSAEQVSIFLTADNTVVSFFECSADDLELPIIHRLSSPDTVLRKSCDASMLLQALLDAIIDLGIPVTNKYEDVIGDMELDVLMEPTIKHTKNLYLVSTEITKMRANIFPIVNLINALKDHYQNNKGSAVVGVASPQRNKTNASKSASDHSTVEISALARTYFGDVEDHVLMMVQSLETMRRSCDNMIDLIFNTISAVQNESMKQLTYSTIIFLPLSFMTGYFGMNFENMSSLRGGDGFFWKVAMPFVAVTFLWMMKDTFKWYITRIMQQRTVNNSRKGRLAREKLAHAHKRR